MRKTFVKFNAVTNHDKPFEWYVDIDSIESFSTHDKYCSVVITKSGNRVAVRHTVEELLEMTNTIVK